jgi:hypothetical protein
MRNAETLARSLGEWLAMIPITANAQELTAAAVGNEPPPTSHHHGL